MQRNRRLLTPRNGLFAASAMVLLVAAVLARRPWRNEPAKPPATAPSAPQVIDEIDETLVRAVKPPPPPEGHVGSEVCAHCHEAIAESYRGHPMSRSAGRVPGDDDIENFDAGTQFQRGVHRRYRVEHTPDGVFHHELMVDARGETVEDVSVPISLFIGSGTRGKTYAVNRGGRLFESQISWFTSDGGRWDLSPGYESLQRRNWERRVGDGCMACHAGRLASDPAAEDTFREPVLLEAGIGCERCHGPGERHVALRSAGEEVAGPDDSIVNPQRLDAARRESVCNQCHVIGKLRLPRYGRTFYDFRPGQLLDEVWTVMVEGSGVRDDGTTKSVSQVQQMRESACYRASAGRMSCNSCHPAHWEPEGEAKADFYRRRCLDCHADRGCSLDDDQRSAPPAVGSCIHCHMPRLGAHDIPHTSQTDHRVPRIASMPKESVGNGLPGADWAFFDHAEERLEPWEIERVKGIAGIASSQQDPVGAGRRLREAGTLLRSALRAAPDDLPVLEGLGLVLFTQDRRGEARGYLERALKFDPRREKVLDLLAELCHHAGEFAQGIAYGQRLIEVNPWIAKYYARQTDMLRRNGQIDFALECGEQGLKIDPWQSSLRAWLVEAYTKKGDVRAAGRHAETLRRSGAN
ncbi:MAG TPA: tetratricopeptide repeat protein [Pirellulales bacterium]|nr:tetratricopeptide repeat protein [Pirellulales bacterium]